MVGASNKPIPPYDKKTFEENGILPMLIKSTSVITFNKTNW